MNCSALRMHRRPNLERARMVLGFSGWMDGGEVSTGCVRALVQKLAAQEYAEISPEDFSICNLPGSMEVSAMFRPHVKVRGGLVESYRPHANTFFCSEGHNLVLLLGREPNLRWGEYADCIFAVAAECRVESIYFIGTVAGLVPHSREPRLFGSVSEPSLLPRLEECGVRATSYEGPAGIATLLLHQAPRRGVRMLSLVSEVPAYVQGRNPRCIESVTRRLAAILGVQVRLDDLRADSDAFERKLNEIVEKKPDLAKLIRKLEEDYDNEVFDTQMGDLKQWLEDQGVSVD